MTKLYTFTFEGKKIPSRKFMLVSSIFLNIDIEIIAGLCLGYEKYGRYTLKFFQNRITFYLAQDFNEYELKNLREQLDEIVQKLGCSSSSEYLYFKEEKIIYS